MDYTDKKSLEKAVETTRKEMEKAAKALDFIQAAALRDRLLELESGIQFAADSIAQQLPVHLCLADACPAFLQVVMKDAVPFNDRHLLAILIDQSRQERRRLSSGKDGGSEAESNSMARICSTLSICNRGCIGAYGDVVFLVLRTRNTIH